jgi:hypothetical protein
MLVTAAVALAAAPAPVVPLYKLTNVIVKYPEPNFALGAHLHPIPFGGAVADFQPVLWEYDATKNTCLVTPSNTTPALELSIETALEVTPLIVVSLVALVFKPLVMVPPIKPGGR